MNKLFGGKLFTNEEFGSNLFHGAGDVEVALEGIATNTVAGTTTASPSVALQGETVSTSSGSLIPEGSDPYFPVQASTGGGYASFGLSTQQGKATREALLKQARQEDMLLLATIKSTLTNPKYGF